MKIYPSILDISFNHWKDWLKTLKKNNIKIIHFDIMDGHFVPVISFGHSNLKLIQELELEINGHFMVDFHNFSDSQLETFFENYYPFLKTIIIHYETINKDQFLFLKSKFQKNKIKIGLAINLETNLKKIEDFWFQIDSLLLMGVKPGFGGQKLNLENIIPKMNFLKKNFPNPSFEITLDGGVKINNFLTLKKLGINSVVIGSDLRTDPELKLQKINNLETEK